jgi:myotubularin-related protein 9
MTGTNNRRCKEDETILNKALPTGKKGIIYDTRDLNTAKNAMYKGGGIESDANYAIWKRVYKRLDTYDQLNVSYTKLIEACNDAALTNDKWLSKLDASGWLNSVRQACYLACAIADEMHNKNACVLLHGAEGLDNTLLISSLVHIILNPESRTLIGFQALCEREWLHAGHPFSNRCFKSAYGMTSQRNEGPVFVLFLDCVWQVCHLRKWNLANCLSVYQAISFFLDASTVSVVFRVQRRPFVGTF